jgi:hypothetical protein
MAFTSMSMFGEAAGPDAGEDSHRGRQFAKGLQQVISVRVAKQTATRGI